MKIDSIEDIKEQIAQTENEQVEFKETTGQLERGMETLCAFLNREGGTVLFGISDKGKIIGQEIADSTKRSIAEAINRLEPTAIAQISYIPIPDNNKKVVVLHAEESSMNRPFCYKGRPYYRVESVTTTMPQAVYNELLILRDGAKYRWELFRNPDFTLQDIDENEVLKTVRLGIEYGRLPENTGNNIPVILEKFGLLKNGMLNHAAAVLFANRELVEYPQCLLRLARFKGTDKTVFMDNQRIQGNLFKLLDAAMAFIFKHLSLSGVTEGLEREEHLTIPYKAIREGVVNSLCHRNYRTAGGSVGIAIYDDRVEIENPGTFPHNWDMEKMKSEYCSEPQNPFIANVLYKRKLLENWGRGISLMTEECKKARLPEPEYKLGDGFVVLVFRFAKSDPTSTRQAPDKYPTSTRQVESLIRLIGENLYSVKEMMQLMQLKDRENFLNNYLTPSIYAGWVEPLYPNQPKHPKQKYYLTEKGKALLTNGI
ncbi:putative DNA binding domain-containing protein [Bacteroides cellulosilyticus]|uniref:ATP-binding protein n=1 Tax=Bacteroides cellulosilyticus TaxID=246787 RepID=UPI001CC96104|nr:ATP-binding protein [Bacteroides cellulosilyticus]UBD70815.1 putative DNA binding domain-containing protein [Bacteroides cellulosilyticus]